MIRPDDGLVTASRVGIGWAHDFFKLLPELVAHTAVDSKVEWTGETHEGVYDEIDEVSYVIIHHVSVLIYYLFQFQQFNYFPFTKGLIACSIVINIRGISVLRKMEMMMADMMEIMCESRLLGLRRSFPLFPFLFL